MAAIGQVSAAESSGAWTKRMGTPRAATAHGGRTADREFQTMPLWMYTGSSSAMAAGEQQSM